MNIHCVRVFAGKHADQVKVFKAERTKNGWDIASELQAEVRHVGRIECIDEAGNLAYAAEGLRDDDSKIVFGMAGAPQLCQATIRLPSFFDDKEFLCELKIKVSPNGELTVATEVSGWNPAKKPLFFMQSERRSGLAFDETVNWRWSIAPLDLSRRTSEILYECQASSSGIIIGLRQVDLGRSGPAADEQGEIRVADRASDRASLTQRLAPSRLSRRLSVSEYAESTTWRVSVGPISLNDACRVWNKTVFGPVAAALQRSRGTHATFVPLLHPLASGREPKGQIALEFEFVFVGAFGEKRPDKDKIVSARLTRLVPRTSTANVRIELMPTVEDSAGKGLRRPTVAANASLSSVDDKLVLVLSSFASGRLELGAMGFEVGDKPPTATPAQGTAPLTRNAKLTIELLGTLPAAIRPDLLAEAPLDIAVRVDDLPLFGLCPGGTDGVPDAERAHQLTAMHKNADLRKLLHDARGEGYGENTLILPLGGADTGPQLRLNADERFEPFRKRLLQLEIVAQRVSGAGFTMQPMLVLDASPFMFGRLPGIGLLPDDDVEEVANYSESELEGSHWEIGGIRRGFTLEFPPQVVGEAAEKGSRFAKAIAVGKPVDYCFSQPAQLTLRSSWNDQRFNEAPWNIRRVLGYPGQRAPGATVVSMDFELLYGMKTSFRAEALPGRVQLAELAARIGAAPPELRLTELPEQGIRRDIAIDAALKLATLRGRYASRLAQFELYNPAEKAGRTEDDRELATADLTIKEGLTFELRAEAQMEHPITAGMQWNSPQGTHPDSLKRLRGGAVWGFESARIFDEVVAKPRSDSGSVGRLRLSALGGYGGQRAVFADGKSVLGSRTEMGRLSDYVLERKGRIGVFWNHARHVIEYRRSVLPSAQFAGEQPRHEGRPVLRKVREYVEILQPRRATHEPGQVALGARFVECCEFQSVVIPVNGAWGRDVDDGWAIPLWDPDAPADLYPRPVVHLQCASAEDEPSGAPQVSEPQRLQFFTSTRSSDGEDTDLWAPVRGIDYADFPIPDPAPKSPQPENYLAPDPGALTAGAPELVGADGKLAPDIAEVPGLYFFTFPLEPDDRPANLVGGTHDERISARLGNVSLMRAARLRTAAADDSGASLLAALGQSEQEFARIVASARKLLDENPSQDVVREQIDRLRPQVDALKISAGIEIGKRTAWLAQQGKANAANTGQISDAVSRGLTTSLRRERESVQRAVTTFRGNAAAFVDSICGTPKEEAIKQTRAWVGELRQLGSGLADSEGEVRVAFGQEVDRLYARVSRLVEAIDVEARGLLDRLTKILTEAAGDKDFCRRECLKAIDAAFPILAASVADARRLLAALPPGVARDVLAPLPRRLEEMQTALQAAGSGLRKVFDQPNWTIVEAKGKVDAAKVKIGDCVKHLRAVIAPLRQFADSVRNESFLEKSTLDTWQEAIAELLVTAINATFDDVAGRCDELTNRFDDAFERAEDALAAVDAMLADIVATTSRNVTDQLHALSTDLEKGLRETLESAAAAVDGLLREMQAAAAGALMQFEDRLEELARPLQPAFGGVADILGRLEQAPSFRDPDTTLRLLRAVGEGPLLPSMSINRDRLAYVFDDYTAAIRTTPAAALIDRVGNDLKALGIRVPFDSIGKELLPPELAQFDVNRVLPDFASLRGMFSNLKMPDLSQQGLRVRHGFDRETQSAWLRADIDVRMGPVVSVFSMAGLSLRLRRGHLTGEANLMVDSHGRLTESKWGKINGDWELSFGGYPLVTFADTPLKFSQEGKLDFAVDVRNVVLDKALRWLEEVLKQYGDPESGFTLELTKGENGAVSGVRAALELALPPQGAGAVTIAGIILHAFLELEISKEEQGSHTDKQSFALSAGFGLGRPQMPFSMFIAFLGGGGYLTGSTTFWPSPTNGNQKFIAEMHLGLAAGAAAAFALGPVQGHVMVLVGLRATYRIAGRGGRLNAALTLLITGRASLYGMVTIGLMLYLEMTYEKGRIFGRGHISVSVRISRFFKLSYSAPIRYELKAGAGGAAANSQIAGPASIRNQSVSTTIAVKPAALPLHFISMAHKRRASRC